MPIESGDHPRAIKEASTQGPSQAGSDMKEVAGELLRQIPAVDELLLRPALQNLQEHLGRRLVLESVREVLQRLRATILRGDADEKSLARLERDISTAAEA